MREYIRYARAAHVTPSARSTMPLLYMNGVEVLIYLYNIIPLHHYYNYILL